MRRQKDRHFGDEVYDGGGIPPYRNGPRFRYAGNVSPYGRFADSGPFFQAVLSFAYVTPDGSWFARWPSRPDRDVASFTLAWRGRYTRALLHFRRAPSLQYAARQSRGHRVLARPPNVRPAYQSAHLAASSLPTLPSCWARIPTPAAPWLTN